MRNKSMERKLKDGEAIDLSKCPRDPGGYYILDSFIEDHDYCNAVTEEWIWSIGERHSDGMILASHDGRFYENPDFKCLWLR